MTRRTPTTLRELRNHAILAVLLGCGLRRGELLALQRGWSQLLGDMTALSADDLPESLQPLAHRQWHRIRLENKWATNTCVGQTDEKRNDPFASMVWPDDVVFRVNVALATERVLVVVGPDGSPRDSLAFSIAATLRWRAYSFA